MPVIAVINRKGGSGKSTLATHLAAWMARQGLAVMLGDIDRQQSTRAWLKRRESHLPSIAAWAMDQKNILKVPPGISHVVLDTPGGMHGLELSKVVMSAHAIVIPVCNSLFDRESASACIAELMTLPRLATGRCQLGVVGMRIDARTHAAQSLREWAQALNVPFLGVLRETQLYVRCLDSGQTVFDLTGTTNKADLEHWAPILQWLQAFMPMAERESAQVSPPIPVPASMAIRAKTNFQSMGLSDRIHAPRAASLMPAQESLVHGSRLSVFSPAQAAEVVSMDESPPTRPACELQRFDSPGFQLRH